MSRPRWLEPLPDAEQMRATDAWAIGTRGIPSLDLMERAGEGLARVIAERVPSGRIVVVCGKGNNGGDGLVAARLLRRAGRDVDVLLTSEADALSEDAGAQLARLPGAAPVRYAAARLAGAAGLVDALLGTGTTGAPRGSAAGVIEDLNGASAPGDRRRHPERGGREHGRGGRRRGPRGRHGDVPRRQARPLDRARARTHAGAVSVIDIGIPGGAPGDADAGLITPAVLRDVPRRGAGSTKFSSGNVVIIGGSRGLTGAPTMAALAAARAGAGYVTVAAAESAELSFTTRLLEVDVQGPARRGRRADARGDRRRGRRGRPRRRGRARARARAAARARRRSRASSCSGSTSRS